MLVSWSSYFFILKFLIYFLCIFVSVSHSMLQVRDQLVGACSLLPACEIHVLHSSLQALWQEPYSVSHFANQPGAFYILFLR